MADRAAAGRDERRLPRAAVAPVIDPAGERASSLLTDPSGVVAHGVAIEECTPRAVSIPIARPAMKVRSFVFDEPLETAPAAVAATPVATPAAAPQPIAAAETAPPIVSTRIKPPGDVVKLEDRLHYLLQPSLESLLAERSLTFPFQPFPFQFEGIAFLYPRQAAILADEMGLGKTMQAITAIRLLLRRGEVRTVLLVCPKPLVTNWQREFAVWAPEVPVMVIEGDQARRAWQWQLPDVPVRIANYELLCRDRELLERRAARPISIWSCSTNRSGSRTAPARPARSSARSRAGGVGP